MMIRPQWRQIARHGDSVRLGFLPSSRHFSISRAAAEGQGQNQPSRPNASSQRPPSAPRPQNSNRPPGTGGPRKPRPAGAVDARSFAAPRSGDKPRIIRRPRMLPNAGGKSAKGKPTKKARTPRAPRPKRAEVDVDDEEQAAAIKQIEQDQILQARPTPVRYEPREIDFSTLRETWPSLPTDANGRTAAVLEKLSLLAARFPNGYVPPYELAWRMWKGQNVLFESEAEKAEALEEVQRISRARADKMSVKKGDLVEPREIKFGALDAKDSAALLETYVQGKYPAVQASKDQPVLGEVVKNLRNNGTYQTAGKRPQFLAKVESLLASGRVKRA
ncbi:hypothetical protein N7492_003591 [Penicillium capsulatum]|uniref:Uncharacterized protein n=1 Tax=Penicillium capsulatum TaxID=69766 RepID=A0A9W9IND4_9EURO|nr:hypothetical protein N7492_003591 [Penicillium capsulatum]KAJ6121826.1 hypothetical protein N7512_004291 [Penicillium capsulatum]